MLVSMPRWLGPFSLPLTRMAEGRVSPLGAGSFSWSCKVLSGSGTQLLASFKSSSSRRTDIVKPVRVRWHGVLATVRLRHHELSRHRLRPRRCCRGRALTRSPLPNTRRGKVGSRHDCFTQAHARRGKRITDRAENGIVRHDIPEELVPRVGAVFLGYEHVCVH